MTSLVSAIKRRVELDRIIFDVVLVVFFVVIVVAGLGLRPRAQFVPLLVGIPALVAMLFQLVVDLFGLGRRKREEVSALAETNAIPTTGDSIVDITKQADLEEELETVGPGASRRRQLVFTGWALAMVVLGMVLTAWVPPILGLRTYYLPVALVGLVAILRYSGLSWLRSILISVPVMGGLYVLLSIGLQIRI